MVLFYDKYAGYIPCKIVRAAEVGKCWIIQTIHAQGLYPAGHVFTVYNDVR